MTDNLKRARTISIIVVTANCLCYNLVIFQFGCTQKGPKVENYKGSISCTELLQVHQHCEIMYATLLASRSITQLGNWTEYKLFPACCQISQMRNTKITAHVLVLDYEERGI